MLVFLFFILIVDDLQFVDIDEFYETPKFTRLDEMFSILARFIVREHFLS